MSYLTNQQIEKLKAFNECFVEHTEIKEVYSDFDNLRMDRLFQSDPKCMLLTGDTGVGKSHLINNYKAKILATQSTTPEKIPVLITRISSTRGLANTLLQILADLELFGSNFRRTHQGDVDLAKQVVKNIKRAAVELLIINEFQELIEFKTAQERQVIANSLKYISEEAQVSIVLVGMPWADQIASEPQWSSRLIRRRNLEYFSLIKNRNYFLRYLMGLANKMPFEEPPKLQLPEYSIPLFSATRGENRALKGLLSEAIKLAFYLKKDSIDSECFIKAFSNIYGTKIQNPFTLDIQEIEISELVENSKYNPNAMTPDDMLQPRVFSKPVKFKNL